MAIGAHDASQTIITSSDFGSSAHTVFRSPSICASHRCSWFQLVKFRVTTSRVQRNQELADGNSRHRRSESNPSSAGIPVQRSVIGRDRRAALSVGARQSTTTAPSCPRACARFHHDGAPAAPKSLHQSSGLTPLTLAFTSSNQFCTTMMLGRTVWPAAAAASSFSIRNRRPSRDTS